MKLKHLLGYIAAAALDMPIAADRIILLAYCNLTVAFIVLVLDRAADHMNKLSGTVMALLVLAMVAIAGSAYERIYFYRQLIGLNM